MNQTATIIHKKQQHLIKRKRERQEPRLKQIKKNVSTRVYSTSLFSSCYCCVIKKEDKESSVEIETDEEKEEEESRTIYNYKKREYVNFTRGCSSFCSYY